jgi:hypothetical protein
VCFDALTSPVSSLIIISELEQSANDAEKLRRGSIEEADVVITSDLILGH